MNYVYDPKIAAQIAAYVNYVCRRSTGAKEVLAKTDPGDREEPADLPDAATLSERSQIFDAEARSTTELQRAVRRTLIGA